MVTILKLILGRDSEDEIDQDLCKNHIAFRSIVPLARFLQNFPKLNSLELSINGMKHTRHESGGGSLLEEQVLEFGRTCQEISNARLISFFFIFLIRFMFLCDFLFVYLFSFLC